MELNIDNKVTLKLLCISEKSQTKKHVLIDLQKNLVHRYLGELQTKNRLLALATAPKQWHFMSGAGGAIFSATFDFITL